MKFGKKIIIINSLIIGFLAAIIVAAAAVTATTVVRSNIRNMLIDTVSDRAALISASKGVVPDNFDYNVSGVYLSVYLSDGTLKNGSFPAALDLPIENGLLRQIKLEGKQYYVYDFAISLEGRNDIYLRGIVGRSYDFWFAAIISVTVFAGVVAAAGVILNVVSVRKAVKPIDTMRKEVNAITVSKDISKRLSKVEADSELDQLARDYNFMLDSLEAMFRNHERFTSDVAHELRTPLTVILSESEYALFDTQKLSEKDESLNVIHRQSKRLKAITDSLLEFTRFANKLSINLNPVNISEITEQFLKDYIFKKQIVCNARIDKDVIAYADATLYERVLQNIIDNAVKYGKEGGNVAVELAREGDCALLKITDDGIGMSEEALKHAFDRFYREERSRSDKSGLGLGLSLVKEIVRLFEGNIEITSKPGKGTCVKITLRASGDA